MARIQFDLHDCELDFGPYCLGGDFALGFEGDGHNFELINAFSCGKRMEGPGLDLIKHWMALDLASPTSRVRRLYQAKLDERTEDDDADDFADYQRDFGRSTSTALRMRSAA